MGVFDRLTGLVGGDDGADSTDPAERSGPADESATDAGNAGESTDPAASTPADFRERAAALAGRSDVPRLDYSVDSLDRLDDVVSGARRPVEDPTDYGSYLGETLVRAYDGEWIDEDGWVVAVSLPDDRTTVAVFDAAAMSLDGDPVFARVAQKLEASGADATPPDERTDDRGEDGSSEDDEPDQRSPAAEREGATPPGDGLAVDESETADGDEDGDDDDEGIDEVGDAAVDDGDAVADEDADPAVDAVGDEGENGDAEGTVGVGQDDDPSTDRDDGLSPDRDDVPSTDRSDAAAGDDAGSDGAAITDAPATPDEDGPGTESEDGPIAGDERADDAGTAPTTADGTADDSDEPPAAESPSSTCDSPAGSGPATGSDGETGGDDVDRDPRTDDPGTEDGATDDDVPPATREAGPDDADVEADESRDVPDGEPGAKADDEPVETGADPSIEPAVDQPVDTAADQPVDAATDESTGDPATTGDEDPDPAARPASGAGRDPDRSIERGEQAFESERADRDVAAEREGQDYGAERDHETEREGDRGGRPGDEGADRSEPVDEGPESPNAAVLQATAEAFTDELVERDMDVTPASLPRFDRFVNRQWQGRFERVDLSQRSIEPGPDADALTQVGAYYGTVLVRWLGAEWVRGESGEPAVEVAGPGDRTETVPVFDEARECLNRSATFAYRYDALIARLDREQHPISDGRAAVTVPAATDDGSPASSAVITAVSDDADELAQAWPDYRLDYSPRSLVRLDELIDREFHTDDLAGVSLGDPTDHASLFLTGRTAVAGSYFATVAVRHLDAQWQIEGDVELVVDGPEATSTVAPFETARECIRRDASFAAEYEAIRDRHAIDAPSARDAEE